MKAEKPPTLPQTHSIWSHLPAAHKKRLWQVCGAYTVLMLAIGGFVVTQSEHTQEVWNSKIPHASIPVTAGYQEEASVQSAVENLLPPPSTIEQSGTIKEDQQPLTIPADARRPVYVSIILDNAGISAKMTEQAFTDLPVGIAFAFSPYAQKLDEWGKKSSLAKREMILQIPMEPFNYPKDDPGPQTLLTRLGVHANEENLKTILARVPDGSVVGYMNEMGGRFLSDPKTLLPVFSTLATKNLFFVEAPESLIPLASTTAEMAGLPYLSAAARLDKVVSADAINQQLAELEKAATDKGYAIGIIDPYPASLTAVKAWADSLDSRGIRLVPLTTIFKEKSRPGNNDHSQEPTNLH